MSKSLKSYLMAAAAIALVQPASADETVREATAPVSVVAAPSGAPSEAAAETVIDGVIAETSNRSKRFPDLFYLGAAALMGAIAGLVRLVGAHRALNLLARNSVGKKPVSHNVLPSASPKTSRAPNGEEPSRNLISIAGISLVAAAAILAVKGGSVGALALTMGVSGAGLVVASRFRKSFFSGT